MDVAILHYHLNRGGVAQVIVNHLRALNAVAQDSAPVRAAILYGGRQEDWPNDLSSQLPGVELSLHVVPELEYDSDLQPQPIILGQKLTATLAAIGFSADTTVLHVHNHSLGKNVSLPGALAVLVQAGYPLLLHIHDFAEDFRPENYRRLVGTIGDGDPQRLSAVLYPQGAQVHYAVLNGRDFQVLRSTGVPTDQLHSLPNPVAGFGRLPSKEEARSKVAERFEGTEKGHYVLYPVRGIRRKNLGEALLWSAVAEPGTHFAVTQPPLNPIERPSYDFWKGLAADLSLPFLFEVGKAKGLTYQDNVAAADAVFTTSVAEGFGMVFLEPWLAGRPLIGRNLPEITADYVKVGVNLDTLYTRLGVPLDWVGRSAFSAMLEETYRRVLADFAQPQPSAEQFNRDVESLVRDGTVDFASLAPSLQCQLVRELKEHADRREKLLELNPQLQDVWGRDISELAASNARAVRENFSLESAGRRLHRLYRTVSASPKTDRLEPPKEGMNVLRAFLSLSRLQPLRIEK